MEARVRIAAEKKKVEVEERTEIKRRERRINQLRQLPIDKLVAKLPLFSGSSGNF
jgi:hypothetical protein